MKIFWAIIGVVVLALVGVSAWVSIFLVAATWLVAAAVAKSTNDNNDQENKQRSMAEYISVCSGGICGCAKRYCDQDI